MINSHVDKLISYPYSACFLLGCYNQLHHGDIFTAETRENYFMSLGDL